MERQRPEWRFDFDNFYMFEVPSDRVESLLPDKINLFEVKPGRALIAYSLHHFLAGNLDGALEDFWELNVNLMVQPILFDDGSELPRFSLYVLYVSSNYDKFLNYARNEDKMPIYRSPGLTIKTDDYKTIDIEDHNGPICRLVDNLNTPNYYQDIIYGQVFTRLNGDIYYTPFSWEGHLYESQKENSDCKLFNHPSISGINVADCEKNCYMQMVGPKVQTNGLLYYGEPVLLKEGYKLV